MKRRLTMEKPTKRQNLFRWRINRLRRLAYIKSRGWADDVQLKRLAQLQRLLGFGGAS